MIDHADVQRRLDRLGGTLAVMQRAWAEGRLDAAQIPTLAALVQALDEVVMALSLSRQGLVDDAGLTGALAQTEQLAAGIERSLS